MAVSPDRPKGPQLNAMRAFEAALRHGSFVAAAEELGVTPGAVSQHVKALEDWAGVALFRRNAQGVSPTAAGRALAPDFTAAFDALAAATHSLRNLRPNGDIHIAALPSVAQLWLPSRLGHIREALPHLNFSVTAMERPPPLSRDLFDLSIFLRQPEKSPEDVILAQDMVFPVASPRIAQLINAGQSMSSYPLLHDQTWAEDWANWAGYSGSIISDPANGPRYSLYSLAVEEAKAGAGILMAHACLVEKEMADGTLCPVSHLRWNSGLALVLTLPHRARRRAEIDAVADLLKKGA